jgi:hypothetical protein
MPLFTGVHGREGKIAIPISPKVIFVTFGVFKFLFGVIQEER